MTYKEIIEHPKFATFFEQTVNSCNKTRLDFLLKDAKANRLKSNPYGVLQRDGNLTFKWMANEFDLVLRKQSEQPVHIREFVRGFIQGICEQTLTWIEKHKDGTD